MKSFFSKIAAAGFLLITLTGFGSLALGAGTAYVPLEPDFIGVPKETSLTFIQYANYAFKVVLTIAILFAVIQIIRGGLAYMASSVPTFKAEGISMIWGAIYGLIIALLSYLVLYTINPKLVNWDTNLTQLNSASSQQK